MFIFRWILKLIERLFTVFVALLFVQIPLFITEYTHQLIGREAELRHYVHAMEKAASLTNKSLKQYILKFLESTDVDFFHQGTLMETMVNRLHNVTDALNALQQSSSGMRPFVLLSHVDSDMFQSTYKHFTFGIPFNLEGLLYAIIGTIIGYALCCCFSFRKKA